jgi:hypothetical protein
MTEEVKADEKLTAALRSLQQLAFVTCTTQDTVASLVEQVTPAPAYKHAAKSIEQRLT